MQQFLRSLIEKRRLEPVIAWLLLIILGLIVVHAPISVFVGTRIPELAIGVKAWKELLMLAAAGLLLLQFPKEVWRQFRTDKLLQVCTLFIVLHIIHAIFSVSGTLSIIAGLMIDLRYIAYFMLVMVFLRICPRYQVWFWRVAVGGAAMVLGFLLIQFVLPVDFLKHLGYGHATIEPYLLVDLNPDYVRYNSTLRGPNPLGVYALIVASFATAWWLWRRDRTASIKKQCAAGGLLLVSLVAVWVSYSRSALMAMVLSIALVVALRYGRAVLRRGWVVLVAGVLVAAAGLYVIRDTAFFHTVIIHDSQTTGADIDSNTGHAESLADGTKRLLQQPFGAGVGSTGSAAQFGDTPLIIENQYLMVAHEVGWLGLALFLAVCWLVLVELWRRRQNWRAAAVWASGLGAAAVGMLLPVWVDDTVAIIWWGLAAVCIASKKEALDDNTNKKTA